MNTKDGPKFPFHYGHEADQYTFYRIPKVLFDNPIFGSLSTDAKLLYGLLLDRMQLSIKNQWVDDDGKVYIYFTLESIKSALSCSYKKAGLLMGELDDKKGIGLITRVKQGLGKPDKVFVHKCVTPEWSNVPFQSGKNDRSGVEKNTTLELSDMPPNNTEIINTDYSEIESIYQDEMGQEVDNYKAYKEFFMQKLEFPSLLIDYKFNQEQLYEILDLLVDTVCTKRKTIRIASDDKPAEIVKSRLMKLNIEHIRYVMSRMQDNTTDVRNIRQYMLAALYNAPATISSYYSALVNHDMYGG